MKQKFWCKPAMAGLAASASNACVLNHVVQPTAAMAAGAGLSTWWHLVPSGRWQTFATDTSFELKTAKRDGAG
jgi:hypothetical protein